MKGFRLNPFKCFCKNHNPPSGHVVHTTTGQEPVALIRPGGVGGAAGTSSGGTVNRVKRRPQPAHSIPLRASGNYATNGLQDVPQEPREQARVASLRSSGRAGRRGAGRDGRSTAMPPRPGNAVQTIDGPRHTEEHSKDPPKEALIRLAVAAGGRAKGGNSPGDKEDTADEPPPLVGNADISATGGRCHIEEHYRDQPRQTAAIAAGDADKEDVFYHLAIAETLQYKDLPDLVDPDFQGFKLDDHAYVAGGKATVEAGQSSKQPQDVPDVYCDICMEHKYSFECMGMKGCSHAYCASCVGQYVKAKVEANEALIACPNTECLTGLIEPDMCRFIISPEIFDRWGTRLCEEGIAGPKKLYCPFKDCSIMVINEGEDNGSAILNSMCPHCRRLFCAKCKVAWHSGFTCEQYQKMKDREPSSKEDKLLVKMANHKKWQRCPNCGFFVERTRGCNYIRCRCGHTFCYKCAGPSNKSSHACVSSKCKLWG